MTTILKHPALQVGVAAIAGIAFGLIVGDWAGELKVFGDLFIRLIQMSIVPLVMASVIVATGGMTGSGVGKLSARTFGAMLGLSCVAAVVGWLLSVAFRPGDGMAFDGTLDPSLQESAAETGTWQETLLGFVSTNVFEAMSEASMIPIILFSLLFGLALRIHINATGDALVLNFLDQVQRVVLTMIRLVMVLAPIGVFCLLAALAGDVGFTVVSTAAKYLGTTALGVVILFFVFACVTVALTRVDPRRLPGKLAEQTAIAVTTTSSAVTFPTVLRNAVEKVGVSQRVANFTLSVGLTMGSYGAVLNYVIVVMFLAQAGDVDLGFGDIAMGMGLAILLNMGTITVPGGFPVVATFLATSMGLPIEAIGLLIAVDWFTGICRTFLNVNGDTLVAMMVANAEDELDKEVYNGTRTVTADDIDLLEYEHQLAAADRDD